MGVVIIISGCGLPFLRTRLEMLKFPSDFNVNSAYYELEETADDVMRNINDFIKVSESARPLRVQGSEVGRNMAVLRRQRSLSEPNLGVEEDVAMDTPPLDCGHPQSPLVGSKVIEMRPESVASQSSAGK